jgi:hypothetical protein
MTYFDKAFEVFKISSEQINLWGLNLNNVLEDIATNYCCRNKETFIVTNSGESAYHCNMDKKLQECERIRNNLPKDCQLCWSEQIPDT